MTGPHPDLALVGYVRGELDADERQGVEAHLAQCATCRAATADFHAILERLAAGTPPAPEPVWSRYRAEIRSRLEARAARAWSRWLRPLPVAVTAVAAAAVVLALALGERAGAPNGDVASLEEAAFATRFDIVEFLEDLDVIRNLDRLTGSREG